jgi:hypothetical protein
MTRLSAAIALALASLPASAATYYVRPDGNSLCDGLTNAAYSSGVTACAKATPAQGVALMVAGNGDTLVIANGSYGLTAALAIPGGTSTAPTRIRGAQAGACKVKPELWANATAIRILDLQANSWIEAECLELTDHNPCHYRHPSHLCSGARGTHGIYAKGGGNLTFRDLNIHGLQNGFKGGGLNTTTWERVRLWGNSEAGWHGSTGCNTSGTNTCDSFTGTHTFRNVEIAWNGCAEQWPALKPHACTGDFDRDNNGTKDGYGDGFGTDLTAGTWIIEDSWVHHNTSDGIDLRYTKEAAAHVTVRRSWAFNNAGNQLKIWGKALVENNVLNSNCAYFGTNGNPRYGQGYNLDDPEPRSLKADPEPCRASGNTLIILPDDGGTGDDAIIRHNTIAGHGAALIQFASGGSTTNYTARIENNVITGATYVLGSALSKMVSNSASVSYSLYSNTVIDAGSVSCTASECTVADPLLRSRTITAFDPRLQSGSPVIGAATTACGTTACVTPATDIRGKTRPSPASRGAFEP